MSNLLSFDPYTRRIWMFPRNIRDIAPWKLYKILKVLIQCEDVNQYSGEEQQMMYRLLDESGIKKKGNTPSLFLRIAQILHINFIKNCS